MTREDTSGPDPTPRSVGGRSGRPAVIVGFCLSGLGGAACWLVFSATRPQKVIERTGAVQLLTVDRPFPAEGRFPGDRYAGTQVCAECHPAEAALHFRSGHSSTLLPAGRRAWLAGWTGRRSPIPNALRSPGAISSATGTCGSRARRTASPKSGWSITRSARAITPRRS